MAQYMSNVVVDELLDKVAMASPTDCINLRICQTPQQVQKIVLSPETTANGVCSEVSTTICANSLQALGQLRFYSRVRPRKIRDY
jgi:hypothetical protein